MRPSYRQAGVTSTIHGGVAQRLEQCIHNAEVGSSNLPTATREKHSTKVGCFSLVMS